MGELGGLFSQLRRILRRHVSRRPDCRHRFEGQAHWDQLDHVCDAQRHQCFALVIIVPNQALSFELPESLAHHVTAHPQVGGQILLDHALPRLEFTGKDGVADSLHRATRQRLALQLIDFRQSELLGP